MRISVIITAPAINDRLRNCLTSIASQNISGLEVLCMMTGEVATSKISDLEKAFEGKLEKLIVRSDSFCGVGEARNKALAIAQGDYLTFCTDGDAFAPTAFRDALNKAVSTDSDLVLFENLEINFKSGATRKTKTALRADMFPAQGSVAPLSLAPHLFQCTNPTPRFKLFAKSLIDSTSLQFESAIRDEDPCFVFTALQNAHRVSCIKRDLCSSIIKAPRTADVTLAEAQGLLDSISQWYKRLREDEAFPQLKASYQLAVLSEIRHTAESFTHDQRRCKFLDKLNEAHFTTTHGISPNYFLEGSPTFDEASYIEAGLAQRIHEQRLTAPSSFDVLQAPNPGMTPDVSVIMPVYNAMPYLAETLDALQQQTLDNIEIICVNDGSSDSSLKELLTRAQQDSRICVVTQQNFGQSRARNVGMGLARGSYLYFMDSDDLISQDALETLVKRSQELDLDLLCFDADTFYETEDLIEKFPSFAHAYERPFWYESVYSGPELLAQLEQDRTYFQSPCLYLIKRSYLSSAQISFIEGILHEDNAFTFACFISAQRASHLNEPLFHRRVREGSTMTSAVTFPRAYGYFLCYEDMLKRYFALEPTLTAIQRDALLRIIYRVLSNAQNSFVKMTSKDRGSALGLCATYEPFCIAVKNPAMKTLELRDAKKKLRHERKKLAEAEKTRKPSIRNIIRALRKKLRLSLRLKAAD